MEEIGSFRGIWPWYLTSYWRLRLFIIVNCNWSFFCFYLLHLHASYLRFQGLVLLLNLLILFLEPFSLPLTIRFQFFFFVLKGLQFCFELFKLSFNFPINFPACLMILQVSFLSSKLLIFCWDLIIKSFSFCLHLFLELLSIFCQLLSAFF